MNSASITYFNLMLISYTLLCRTVYSQDAKLINDSSFKDKEYLEKWDKEACCVHSITKIDSLSVSGNYSTRFELRKEDKQIFGGSRSEIKTSTEKRANIERWYRVNYYIPFEYCADDAYEIVSQWHGVPDRHLGESLRSPPLALLTQEDKWRFRIIWASQKVNTNKNISGKKIFDLGNIEKNKWTEFIFHIRFSYKNDGILEIWKDRKLVVSYSGPNYYNDEKGPFFKVGIYKSGWNNPLNISSVDKRILFIDGIKIGNETFDLKTISD